MRFEHCAEDLPEARALINDSGLDSWYEYEWWCISRVGDKRLPDACREHQACAQSDERGSKRSVERVRASGPRQPAQWICLTEGNLPFWLISGTACHVSVAIEQLVNSNCMSGKDLMIA